MKSCAGDRNATSESAFGSTRSARTMQAARCPCANVRENNALSPTIPLSTVLTLAPTQPGKVLICRYGSDLATCPLHCIAASRHAGCTPRGRRWRRSAGNAKVGFLCFEIFTAAWTRGRFFSHAAAILPADLEQRIRDLTERAYAHGVHELGEHIAVLDHRLLEPLERLGRDRRVP